tara:strand:- start:1182 stop:2258 length:1077 start_codon:yes stop_codon:yes gene_type:complete
VLYHIFYSLVPKFGFLNVTRYITFRAIVSLLTAFIISLLLSPWFIKKLKHRQMKQVVRNDGPKSHLSKTGTPTMGGGLIAFAVLLPSLLWINWLNPYLWLVLGVFLSYVLIGFTDDYLKIHKKNPEGLSGKMKLFWQTVVATLATCLSVYYLDSPTYVYVPFFKNLIIEFGLAYIPFAVFIIVGTSNAVNLTDGLDGLAVGPIIAACFCYTILAYISGHSGIASYLSFPFVNNSGELAIFAATMIGACLGFLWYNTYPAQVFMGDVGSLPLGGALGALAVFSKHELLLAIIGGIFVLEALSVITQVLSFKLLGRRIFKMAPIHHHFELQGWPEPRVIVRFWIISILLALLGLLSLKIR